MCGSVTNWNWIQFLAYFGSYINYEYKSHLLIYFLYAIISLKIYLHFNVFVITHCVSFVHREDKQTFNITVNNTDSAGAGNTYLCSSQQLLSRTSSDRIQINKKIVIFALEMH